MRQTIIIVLLLLATAVSWGQQNAVSNKPFEIIPGILYIDSTGASPTLKSGQVAIVGHGRNGLKIYTPTDSFLLAGGGGGTMTGNAIMDSLNNARRTSTRRWTFNGAGEGLVLAYDANDGAAPALVFTETSGGDADTIKYDDPSSALYVSPAIRFRSRDMHSIASTFTIWNFNDTLFYKFADNTVLKIMGGTPTNGQVLKAYGGVFRPANDSVGTGGGSTPMTGNQIHDSLDLANRLWHRTFQWFQNTPAIIISHDANNGPASPLIFTETSSGDVDTLMYDPSGAIYVSPFLRFRNFNNGNVQRGQYWFWNDTLNWAIGNSGAVFKIYGGLAPSDGQVLKRLNGVWQPGTDNTGGGGPGTMSGSQIQDSLDTATRLFTKRWTWDGVNGGITIAHDANNGHAPPLIFTETSGGDLDSVFYDNVSGAIQISPALRFTSKDFHGSAQPNTIWMFNDTMNVSFSGGSIFRLQKSTPTNGQVLKNYGGVWMAANDSLAQADSNTFVTKYALDHNTIRGELALGVGDSVQITTLNADTSYGGVATWIDGAGGVGDINIRFYTNHVVVFETPHDAQGVSNPRFYFTLFKKQYPVAGVWR